MHDYNKLLSQYPHWQKLYGYQPIHFFARFGVLDAVQSFINNDPEKLHALDNDNNTPLHIASVSGQLNIVQCLCQQGAEINDLNKNNETPLQRAMQAEQEDVVKYLQGQGAQVTPKPVSSKCTTSQTSSWQRAHLFQCLPFFQNLWMKNSDENMPLIPHSEISKIKIKHE